MWEPILLTSQVRQEASELLSGLCWQACKTFGSFLRLLGGWDARRSVTESKDGLGA